MWHWLVREGHIYAALVGWTVGFLMATCVVGGLSRVAKRLWARHLEGQRQLQEGQREIVRALDPTTPGGLGELDLPIRPSTKGDMPTTN